MAAAYLKGGPVEGEIAVITNTQVKEADYNLSPGRWIGQSVPPEHESILEIIDEVKRLSSEANAIWIQLEPSLLRVGGVQ